MIAGHPTKLVLAPVTDLTADERDHLYEHLRACPSCTRQFEDLKSADELIGAAEEAVALRPLRAPRRTLLREFMVPTAKIAAAVVFALVFGVTAGGILRDRGTSAPSTALGPGSEVGILRGVLPDPAGRVVGTAPGEDAPDFEWTTAGRTARLSGLRGHPVLLAVWDAGCACEGILERAIDQFAAERAQSLPVVRGEEPRVVAVVQGESPDRLRSFARKHPDFIVIADPDARSVARYRAADGISAFVLSSDGRTARVVPANAVPIAFRITGVLAQARSMTAPPIVGTVVEIRDPVVVVQLESAMMSAQFGRPARFHADASTAYQPSVAGLSALGLRPGDRVRLAWAAEVFDTGRQSYKILTIGRE